MKRHDRLQSAKAWMTTQQGRTAVQIGKSYRQWYGVDWPCAIQELTRLGVAFDPEWVAALTRSLAGHHRVRAARRVRKADGDDTGFGEDSNAEFAYIAGYTPNGVPFGVTWEEWDKLEAAEAALREERDPF